MRWFVQRAGYRLSRFAIFLSPLLGLARWLLMFAAMIFGMIVAGFWALAFISELMTHGWTGQTIWFAAGTAVGCYLIALLTEELQT